MYMEGVIVDKEKLFNSIKGAADKAAETAKNVGGKTGELAKSVGSKTGEIAKSAGSKATDLVTKSKDKATEIIDQNGDGRIDAEDIIILGLRTPGVKINRADFLKKEFSKNHPEDVVNDIVLHNPAHAKIDDKEIDKIAEEVIKYERICVSGISTALGMPGGAAMAATIPADIAQYYGYMLRAAQKLMYLYGFPEINLEEKGQLFDSEALNVLTLCIGVMYGAAGANNAVKAMARGLATGVEKQLMRKALTKGTFYPIVKSISKWFGKKMTKEVFAGFFKKSIPVVGGIIGGGITFATFKPCCDKLKATLEDTYLSNPEHVETKEEAEIVIEAEVTDYSEADLESESEEEE